MILVASGGLGNQIFTLAAALRISERAETKIKIYSNQIELVDRVRNLQLQYNFPSNIRVILSKWRGLTLSRICLKLFLIAKTNQMVRKLIANMIVVIECPWEYPFDREEEMIRETKVLFGFFQNKDLVQNLNIANRTFLAKIFDPVTKNSAPSQSSKSISIGAHLRRGDYSQIPEYGLLSLEYFRRAIDKYVTNGSRVVLASDDMSCLEELGTYEKQLLLFPRDYSPLKTMVELSKVDVFVMSNSTFSFWIGWKVLQNGGKVLAPNPWFRENYTPEGFLLLDEFQLLSSIFD